MRPPKAERGDADGTSETTPPWQSAAPFDRERGREADRDRDRDRDRPGRPKSPMPAASFQARVAPAVTSVTPRRVCSSRLNAAANSTTPLQDLVLLNRTESTCSTTSAAQLTHTLSNRSAGGGDRSPRTSTSVETLARQISATLGGGEPGAAPHREGSAGAAEGGGPRRASEDGRDRRSSGGDGGGAATRRASEDSRGNGGGDGSSACAPSTSPFAVKGSPGRGFLVNRRPSASKPDGRPAASSGAGASERRRLAIIMVGLPARGKTFTAQKLARYLNWLGHETKHFNVGKYRRDFVGSSCTAQFFSAGNTEAVASRNEVAKMALEDMLKWMEGGGQVGIFDATNSTVSRRALLTETLRGKCKIIFLETICTDREMIERNVLEKITRSPDYAGMDPQVVRCSVL